MSFWRTGSARFSFPKETFLVTYEYRGRKPLVSAHKAFRRPWWRRLLGLPALEYVKPVFSVSEGGAAQIYNIKVRRVR